MTVGDLKRFYINKEEHYEISDRFIKCGYQQINSRPNTYIGYAKECGIEIDHLKASPNQKWHMIKAYCEKKASDEKIYRNKLKCPELLLWMAEAAGMDKKTIDKAEKEAREIIDEGKKYARVKAAFKIFEIIKWEELEKIIMEN